MNEARAVRASYFQGLWILVMFVFLWISNGMIAKYLIPLHLHAMSLISPNEPANDLLATTLTMLKPVFYITLLSLLLMGITQVRYADDETGKKKLSLNRTPALWRKAVMSALIVAAILLNIGLLSAWPEIFLRLRF